MEKIYFPRLAGGERPSAFGIQFGEAKQSGR